MAFQSINPHDPSEILGQFEEGGPLGVEVAVFRAREAFAEWSGQPASARGEALWRIANDLEGRCEDIAFLMAREVGKPITEARAEVARAVSILHYYSRMVLAPDGESYPASIPGDWLITRRRPLGVCALLTPWNFPVAIPIWKAAPALAYGNTVVLKPAPDSSVIAGTLGAIVSRHLPEGAFQLVFGDAETGEPLVKHPSVSAVSFTGSVEVGRDVAREAGGRGARVQCEMGGQNPSVVLEGADLDRASSTIAYAAMGYAGQKCTATSRVIVEETIYEEVRDRLIAAVEGMEIVNPGEEATQVGPLIGDASRSFALEILGRSEGRILTGGKPLDGDGFYLEPTLVEVEDTGNPLVQEEVFAPVAAMIKAGSASEALDIANGVRYGLVAAVFTDDLERAMMFADSLESGLVRVNAATSGVDFHAPFGGSKDSGIGAKEQGFAARDFFTETRTVLISP